MLVEPPISDRLRAACAELGWSPTNLAHEAGVTEQAARAWLNGDRVPAGDTIVSLMQRHMVVRERLLGSAA